MVWARACEIGCAIALCPDDVGPSGKSGPYSQLLVCAYGPRFPMTLENSRPPYQAGRGRNARSCQHCRNGFRVCDTIDEPDYGKASAPPGIKAMGDVGNLCCKRRLIMHTCS